MFGKRSLVNKGRVSVCARANKPVTGTRRGVRSVSSIWRLESRGDCQIRAEHAKFKGLMSLIQDMIARYLFFEPRNSLRTWSNGGWGEPTFGFSNQIGNR